MQVLMRRLSTLIQMLASKIPELKGIESRSEAMVTCCKMPVTPGTRIFNSLTLVPTSTPPH